MSKNAFWKLIKVNFFFLAPSQKNTNLARCAFCDLDFSWPFFFIFSLLVVHSEDSELFINSFRLSNLWNHSLIRGVLLKCHIYPKYWYSLCHFEPCMKSINDYDWIIKYILLLGKLVNSGGAILYKNSTDQTL